MHRNMAHAEGGNDVADSLKLCLDNYRIGDGEGFAREGRGDHRRESEL